MMAASEKFLFDTTFDPDTDPKMAPESGKAKKATPQYGEEDLVKSHEEGFAIGKQAGINESRQEIENTASQVLAAIHAQLSDITSTLDKTCDNYCRETITTAMKVVQKLFPRLTDQFGLLEIEGIVKECLERLPEEPRVVIRVTDSMMEPLKSRIDPLVQSSGFEGKIVIIPEDSLSASDVRVEWADGGAEGNSASLLSSIDEIIERTIGKLDQNNTTAPAKPAAELEKASTPSATAPSATPCAPATNVSEPA